MAIRRAERASLLLPLVLSAAFGALWWLAEHRPGFLSGYEELPEVRQTLAFVAVASLIFFFVRGFNNQLIVLPNSLIARERLEVFPRNNLNARVLQINIDYHVPPAKAIEVLTQAAAHVEGVAREQPALARVAGFGDSAVLYEIKYFTRDYS